MVGLTVKNAAGYVQINEDFQNLELVQVANNVTTQPHTEYAGVTSAYMQTSLYTASTPVIAFGTGFLPCLPTMLNSPNWRNSYYNYRIDVVGPTNSYAPSWLFDMSFNFTGTGGLMVYTQSGLVAYDSDKKYLRILESGSLSAGSDAGYQRDYRGKSVAIVLSRPGLRQFYTTVNGASYLNNARPKYYQDPETGLVTINWHSRQVQGQVATIPLIQRDTKFFLVDVSNYRTV